MWLIIVRDVARIASAIYAMVMHKFGPVFCIYVSIAKGIMKLTLLLRSHTEQACACMQQICIYFLL